MRRLEPGAATSQRFSRGAAVTDSLEIVGVFAHSAELYIGWFDEVVSDEASPLSMRKLHEVLASVQAAAARLTGITPGDEADAEFEKKRAKVDILKKKLPVDAYAVIFNPLEYDPTEVNPPIPVMATISNDLSDIHWRDRKRASAVSGAASGKHRVQDDCAV
jgi:hypothetical protein